MNILNALRQTHRRSLILLIIWTIILIVGSIWLESIWVFVLLFPFFFDGYVTHIIPWRWWQHSDSKLVRSSMKLLEDVVTVLVLVYILTAFIFQQFKIPSSSLEKSYLVGDRLFVNKLTYGPRVPMTPIAFPLVHNQFPWGGKAYIERPQLTYKRLKGFRSVRRNDIVVFNFPAGDTVSLNVLNPDYYTLVHLYGRQRIHSDEATFGKVVYRPVDMRDHYVKRVVGMPGDTLMIRDNELYIDGHISPMPPKAQLNYFVQSREPLSIDVLSSIGISRDDMMQIDNSRPEFVPLCRDVLHLDTLSVNNYGLLYHFPLTADMKSAMQQIGSIANIVVEPSPSKAEFTTYPLDSYPEWRRDHYGPIWIPYKGATIQLTTETLPLYERCIRNFEGHTLSIQSDGTILIDGAPATSYTFRMNYYFMMGDNRHNSADSRAWGFVPEDHIVGTPAFVWLSIDKDKPWTRGGIRWERFLTRPE